MKKAFSHKFIYCLAIVAVGFLLFVFIRNSPDNSPPPKPSDTNLAFWITQDVSRIDFSHYEEITGWFGARQYYGHGYHSTIDSDPPDLSNSSLRF